MNYLKAFFVISVTMFHMNGFAQDSKLIPSASLHSNQNMLQIDINIYQILGDISGDTSLTDSIFVNKNPAEFSAVQDNVTYFTLAKLQLGDVLLEANMDEWNWKNFDADSKWVKKFSSPKLLATLQSDIQLSTNNEIEYAVRQDNGLYEIKTYPEKSGLTMVFKCKSIENDLLDIEIAEFTIVTVYDRKPVMGTNLNIGEPIISKVKHQEHLKLHLDYNYGMMIHTDGQGVWLIQMKVKEMQI